MIFIGLEKSNDRVSRDLIWWVLDKRSSPRGYIDIIRGMYKGAVANVRTTYRETWAFNDHWYTSIVNFMLLPPYTDHGWWVNCSNLTRGTLVLFIDDIVLIDKSKDVLNVKLERWWEALVSKGLKISCTKLECINCNFSRKMQRGEISMRIECQEIL